MKEKKRYEEPTANLIELGSKDIITDSNPEDIGWTDWH